ncbi:MAG: peptide-methionine (S)-S-oxide reductase MsrA [Lentisphaerae bacterium]|nr:peptide-methionine (S)-S-oxide reductase MsrA [Lentisphaerota bacterium]
MKDHTKPGIEPPAVATFAGGCFWSMERAFEEVPGVTSAVSGYTGGDKPDPTYDEVSAGHTRHMEAVQVHYDPSQVSYRELLDIFWEHVDPTAEHGTRYRTAIFHHTEAQKQAAERSKHRLAASSHTDGTMVTRIEPAKPFYEAEAYHQDFFKKRR